jgi:hypothetical protein
MCQAVYEVLQGKRDTFERDIIIGGLLSFSPIVIFATPDRRRDPVFLVSHHALSYNHGKLFGKDMGPSLTTEALIVRRHMRPRSARDSRRSYCP